MSHAIYSELEAKLAAVTAQRDELLEACKAALVATGGSKYWNGETEKFLKLCEAAVEKADPSWVFDVDFEA